MSVSSETSDTNSNPTVAVIIPCHNHSSYVGRAIQSVLDQDYPAKMLAVVDDGSTDDSFEVIKTFMDKETHQHEDEDTSDIIITGVCQDVPMIIVHRPEARKQAAARNTAIKLAWQNADLFCPLDADDLFLPHKLTKCVAAYQKSPNFIGLVYNDVIIHDERDDTYVREFREPYNRELLELHCMIPNVSLVSKDALGYSGLYDEDLPPCEDWDLWLRITENFVAIHIPEPLHQYTTHGKNCSFTVSEDIWNEQRAKIHAKLMKRKQLRHGTPSQ